MLVHNKAAHRLSWDYRCQDGYYVGPALQHYRCYQVISKHSGAIRISDAIKFRHHYLPEPTIALEDKLLFAVQAIHHTLTQAAPTTDQLSALQTLRSILRDYKTVKTTATATQPPNRNTAVQNTPTTSRTGTTSRGARKHQTNHYERRGTSRGAANAHAYGPKLDNSTPSSQYHYRAAYATDCGTNAGKTTQQQPLCCARNRMAG